MIKEGQHEKNPFRAMNAGTDFYFTRVLGSSLKLL
jgi:hypothetical protein